MTSAMEVDGEVNSNQKESQKQNDGARVISIHPLCLVTVADHYTRAVVGGGVQKANSKVLGILLGEQSELDVSIYDASEIGYDKKENGEIVLHQESVVKQKDLYSAVYPSYEVLGWYSVGTEPSETDIEVHRQMMQHNVSPLFVLLDPSPSMTGKSLPVNVYEGEVHHVANDQPSMAFVHLPFQLQTTKSEQVSVEHVVRATPKEGSSGLDRHATTLGTSLSTLTSRIEVLQKFLVAVQSGQITPDYKLLRQVASITNELRGMEGESGLRGEFIQEYTDSMMVGCLAALQQNAAVVGDFIEKHEVCFADKKYRST